MRGRGGKRCWNEKRDGVGHIPGLSFRAGRAFQGKEPVGGDKGSKRLEKGGDLLLGVWHLVRDQHYEMGDLAMNGDI